MKKFYSVGVLILLIGLCCSCGTKKKKVDVKDVEFYCSFGEDMDDLIKVPDGFYAFEFKGDSVCITIPVEVTGSFSGMKLKSIEEFVLWPENAEGNNLRNSADDDIEFQLQSLSVLNSLFKGQIGSRHELRFVYRSMDKKLLETIYDNVYGFSILSRVYFTHPGLFDDEDEDDE